MENKILIMSSIFESDLDRIKYNLRNILVKNVKRLGQCKVGDIVGSHQPNISRALNPNKNIKLDTLTKWLYKLGYEINISIDPYPDWLLRLK